MRRIPVFRSAAMLAAVLFIGMGGPLAGETTVLFDSGEAVPAAQYLSSLFSTDDETPPGLAFVSFPVHTHGMASGELPAPSALKRAAWLAQPVFLIGTDRRSRDWLSRHRDDLHGMGAQGIVVEAESLAALRELQALSGLPLAPASMDGAAEQLGLRVYPVLIRMDGMLVQQVTP